MPQAARELDSSSKTPEAAGPGLASGPAQVGRARAGAAPGKRPRRPACPPARPPAAPEAATPGQRGRCRRRYLRSPRRGGPARCLRGGRGVRDRPRAPPGSGAPTPRSTSPVANGPRLPSFCHRPGHTRPASPAGLRRAPRANSRAASPPPPGARPARPGGGGGWRAAPGPRRPDGAPVGGRRAPGASLRRCAEPPRRSGLPTPGPRRRSRLGRRARGSRGRSAARPRLP